MFKLWLHSKRNNNSWCHRDLFGYFLIEFRIVALIYKYISFKKVAKYPKKLQLLFLINYETIKKLINFALIKFKTEIL